jgi:hypothetical protein
VIRWELLHWFFRRIIEVAHKVIAQCMCLEGMRIAPTLYFGYTERSTCEDSLDSQTGYQLDCRENTHVP